MMEAMPRSRPPFLLREVTRHGKVKWYVRVGKGPRIRMPAYGTPEFDAEYEAAITGKPKRIRGAPAAGRSAPKLLVFRRAAGNAFGSAGTKSRPRCPIPNRQRSNQKPARPN